MDNYTEFHLPVQTWNVSFKYFRCAGYYFHEQRDKDKKRQKETQIDKVWLWKGERNEEKEKQLDRYRAQIKGMGESDKHRETLRVNINVV